MVLPSAASGRLPIARALARLGVAAVDLVLPPRCLSCGEIVGDAGGLCAVCWEKLDFIGPPHCAACGLPFEFESDPAALCGACRRAPPPFDRARSVLAYEEGSRQLLLAFKHGDRLDGAPAFGRWLARSAGELIAEADVVVPVPLHWRRLLARRYNQAALLAQALGRHGGLPVVADLLERRRATPPQARRSPSARRQNVAGAFRVKAARRALIADRRVLLVDDVMTTGATLEACSRTLLAAGACGVDAITLARVVRPRPIA